MIFAEHFFKSAINLSPETTLAMEIDTQTFTTAKPSSSPTADMFEITGVEPDFEIVGGGPGSQIAFHLHKLYLIGSSEVFSGMFQHGKETEDGPVSPVAAKKAKRARVTDLTRSRPFWTCTGQLVLTGDRPMAFKMYLQWLYRYEQFDIGSLTNDQFDGLFKLVDKYHIRAFFRELSSAICKRIGESKAPGDLFYTALRHGIEEEPLAMIEPEILMMFSAQFEETVEKVAAINVKLAYRLERNRRKLCESKGRLVEPFAVISRRDPGPFRLL